MVRLCVGVCALVVCVCACGVCAYPQALHLHREDPEPWVAGHVPPQTPFSSCPLAHESTWPGLCPLSLRPSSPSAPVHAVVPAGGSDFGHNTCQSACELQGTHLHVNYSTQVHTTHTFCQLLNFVTDKDFRGQNILLSLKIVATFKLNITLVLHIHNSHKRPIRSNNSKLTFPCHIATTHIKHQSIWILGIPFFDVTPRVLPCHHLHSNCH